MFQLQIPFGGSNYSERRKIAKQGLQFQTIGPHFNFKVYEDTLVIERKIRGFGLFSEELEWILMALLKDNEELKNIVKVGFKEVEREMQDMDDVMKKENSARANEVKQVQHLLNEQRDDVETRLSKVEKDLKSQMSNMAEQCDDALKNMRIKFMKEIDETLEERIPDINGRFRIILSKILLASFQYLSILDLCSFLFLDQQSPHSSPPSTSPPPSPARSSQVERHDGQDEFGLLRPEREG